MRRVLRPFTRTLACLALPLLVTAASCGTPSPRVDDEARRALERWAADRAAPLTDATFDRLAGRARLLAVGESAHGVEEALAFRNRLFRRLVTARGFTGIALETGYADARRIDAFVSGAPGNAVDVVPSSMTSGFGNFSANVELVEWMRAWNATAAAGARLRFFGIDLSLGGPTGSRPTAAPIDCALDALDAHDPATGRSLRAAFAPVRQRLDDQRELTAGDRDAYASFVASLARAAAATGDREAVHCASIAAQAGRVDAAAPAPSPFGGIPATAWRAIEARDRAMAENVLWSLRELGEGGRLLVFAHNAHVMSAPRRGGVLAGQRQAPRSMGQQLRGTAGRDLVIVAEAGAGARSPAEIGDVLRAAHPGAFVLFVADAPASARTLLSTPIELRENQGDRVIVEPATAFDALVVQAAATPARVVDTGRRTQALGRQPSRAGERVADGR